MFDAKRDAEELDALLDHRGTSVDPGVRSRLLRYAELVSVWGARTDLTSAKTPRELVSLLFLDALVLAQHELVPSSSRLVDVGAGVGAPTIPLLIIRPDLEATLVEPRRKRVAFLRTALGADPVLPGRARVLHGRLEQGEHVEGATFDVALSRATFAPADWLAMGLEVAPRVLVMTAGEPPPAPEGVAMVARADYRVVATFAPRTVTAYDRRRPGETGASAEQREEGTRS